MKRAPQYRYRRRIAAASLFTAFMVPLAFVDGCQPDPITDRTPPTPLTLP